MPGAFGEGLCLRPDYSGDRYSRGCAAAPPPAIRLASLREDWNSRMPDALPPSQMAKLQRRFAPDDAARWGATSGRAGGEDEPWSAGTRLLERVLHGGHAWARGRRRERGGGEFAPSAYRPGSPVPPRRRFAPSGVWPFGKEKSDPSEAFPASQLAELQPSVRDEPEARELVARGGAAAQPLEYRSPE